jgi:excisionase family DNA binding protein
MFCQAIFVTDTELLARNSFKMHSQNYGNLVCWSQENSGNAHAYPQGAFELAEKLLYRVAEAAEALSMSRSKVYQMINEGQLPVVRVGGTIRVPVAGLLALIEQAPARVEEAAL